MRIAYSNLDIGAIIIYIYIYMWIPRNKRILKINNDGDNSYLRY